MKRWNAFGMFGAKFAPRLACAALVASLSIPAVCVCQEPDADAAEAAAQGSVDALFKEGMTRFLEGNLDEAVKGFEKALALNPTNDQILKFLDSANASRIMQMVRSNDARIAGIGRSLLGQRSKARKAKSSDMEAIKALVEKVFASDSEQEKLVEMVRGAHTYGRNLVPALIEKLGSPESGVRTLAFLWVTKIEIDAIPPLLAAARHSNALVRQSTARLLGVRSIRDSYSLGMLKAMVESDSDPEVKRAAGESIVAIASERDLKDQSAKDALLDRARLLYLKGHLNPFAGQEYTPTVFHLAGEQVVGEPVAAFQLSSRMAEQLLDEALRLDPGFKEARIQRLSNEALQVLEYDAAIAGADASQKEALASQLAMMNGVRRMRLLSSGRETLTNALALALHDRRSEVALKLIEVVDDLQLRGEIPPALKDALNDPNSRLVRVASAVALSRWTAEERGPALSGAVVGTLTEAAVSSGIRTVHKAMGNADNVARFDVLFRDLNMESGVNSADIAAARGRAVELPPDLIVVDDELKSFPSSKAKGPVNQLVAELRRHSRTQSVPILVAVPTAKLEEARGMYESEERKVLVISAESDQSAFKTQVLDKLFAGSDDAKARATKMAARAALALANMAATTSGMDLSSAVPALLTVLHNRPDEVRIPALLALGHLRGQAASAVKPMAQVFANVENSPQVRTMAMSAMAMVLSSGDAAAPAEVVNVILAGMADANPSIRATSFAAYGAANAAPAAQFKVLIESMKAPVPAAEAAPKAEGDAPAAGEAAEPAEKAVEAPKEEPATEEPAEKSE